MRTEGIVGLLVILVTILALVFAPLGTIWAINTLFGFAIAYSSKTWAATVILGIFFRGVKING